MSNKIVSLVVLFTLSVCCFAHPSFHRNDDIQSKEPVPVDLFVMSKCPDAVYCESVFSTVLKKVKVPVNLDINYIAQYDDSTPYAHTCKHGGSECLGNIQQLCFRHEYPHRDDWFSFNLCLNRDYQNIGLNNTLAEDCAHNLKKSYKPVDECAHSKFGVGLLTDSAQKTKALGVKSSCTVHINRKLRCIHDGVWKNCPGGHKVQDFIRTIEEAYDSEDRY